MFVQRDEVQELAPEVTAHRLVALESPRKQRPVLEVLDEQGEALIWDAEGQGVQLYPSVADQGLDGLSLPGVPAEGVSAVVQHDEVLWAEVLDEVEKTAS